MLCSSVIIYFAYVYVYKIINIHKAFKHNYEFVIENNVLNIANLFSIYLPFFLFIKKKKNKDHSLNK